MLDVVRVTSEQDYQEALRIRRLVFVEEQGVPAALEVAGEYERKATYFLVSLHGQAIGTGRFRMAGPTVKFERIATLKEARGQGAAAALMRVMQAEAARELPRHLRYMHAQDSAVPFYHKLGWRAVGEPFSEAGIYHRIMVLVPATRLDFEALLCWSEPGAIPAAVLAEIAG